ncbi:MAG: CotH kinase family protein [Lachnospiraceae bacterium]|nr:CotH kinase family protein [Lachnospiraceae bacterium]MBQ7864591.1 CotH kinase family protein [Lachnospiraceae bacterium]
MKNKRKNPGLLCFVTGVLLGLAACNETPVQMQEIRPTIIAASTPTPIIVPTNTPTPTITPAVETATPVPTEAPAPTESPTPTLTLAPTNTPTPTPTPTPVWKGTEGEVTFSEAGYFFTEDLLLELEIAQEKEGYITYTMDGSEPLAEGAQYDEPLLLAGTEEASPNVYTIRAKAWYADGSSSETYVHTYFVGEQVESRYSTLVFSISGNPAELTGEPDGILYGENYTKRGRESERKVSIEAITAEGEPLFAQYAGVRVYGGSSRKFPVKSLKLFARKEYQEDKGTFGLSVFESTTVDGRKLIKKYDKLVLRNGGDDFQRAFLRDELAQRLAEKAGFAAYEAVVPAVAYLNGEYYGFYWLHESYCDKYFQKRNGDSDGEYIVLEGSDSHKSLKEDPAEYEAAREYNRTYAKFAKSDLTNDEIYAQVCAWIDVENYLDYMSFNMYISNYDWPGGNYRCFRYYAAEGEEYGTGEKDGRWRFLMHDADVGFATYYSAEEAADNNDITQVLAPDGKRRSALLAALLKREDCQTYFIDKMLEYRDGALSYESVCETLDAMCAERDGEFPYYLEHLNQLRKAGAGVWATAGNTKASAGKIKEFAKIRGDYVTKYLEEFFEIELE